MSFDADSIIRDFCVALRARGIMPPPRGVVADGRWHRCDAEGRPGKLGASYRLHMNGHPAGGFQNHHDGLGWQNWKSEIEDTRTPAEKARSAAEIEENKRQRAREMQENQARARQRAAWIWDHVQAATAAYPYLGRKQVPAIGLGLYKDALVVPMLDIEGELHSLQFIKEDGSKTFLKFGRVEGCFFGLGELTDTLYVAEGYATAASIHQATGAGVAVAFNSGNLVPVARALRQKYPTKTLIICADDDVLNVLRAPPLPNVGLLAAYEAARTVRGYVAVPVFPPARLAAGSVQQVRGSVFRALAAHASMDDSARWYRRGLIDFIDQYVIDHRELANDARLAWGTIALHLRNETRLLADETDFNDLHLLMGLKAVRTCLDRAMPPPSTEVQALSFDIAI